MSDLVISREEEITRLWRVARAAKAVTDFDGPFHSTYHSELLVELDEALASVWGSAEEVTDE